MERTTVHCPTCEKPVWGVASNTQRLNKCWNCGTRFDSPEIEDDADYPSGWSHAETSEGGAG